jgi:hypothetical protein
VYVRFVCIVAQGRAKYLVSIYAIEDRDGQRGVKISDADDEGFAGDSTDSCLGARVEDWGNELTLPRHGDMCEG